MELSPRIDEHNDAGDLSRRWVAVGLGILWLFDGILQLQPLMFTKYFANNASDVIASSFQSLPRPLYLFSMNALIRYVSPHMVIWNILIVLLQILLGVTLIAGRNKIIKIGLITSILWGGFVWIFGEGMGRILAGSMSGGIFPGTPSILSGFPGAALLYSLVGLYLLLPIRFWNVGNRFSIMRMTPPVLFILLAVIQTSPLLWTTYGQSSIFLANTGNLPGMLSSTLAPLVNFTISHPLLSNLFEMSITLFVGVSLLFQKFKWNIVIAFAWLAFIWWFGVGLGGLLTGMGTDLNTPPVIALLLIPLIVSRRVSKSEINADRRRIPIPQKENSTNGCICPTE
jgi:hypothetical protein